MTAEELYEQLKLQGVELWSEGKMLRFKAAESALSRDTLVLLRRHKKELIEIVKREAGATVGGFTLEAPSVSQQAMYFLHLSAPHSPAYNVASACRIRSVLDTAAVEAAFETLISRYDSLRTTFQVHEGALRRRVHATAPLNFEQVDVAGQSEEEVRQIVRDSYQEPFNLADGPLLRVRLFTSASDDHVFLISLHHIIFDAWSLWLLQDEFRMLYAQHTGGETALLPALTASYTDYVDELAALETSDRGDKMWQYWQQRLAGDLPTLELPVDRPRPKSTTFRGATHKFRIPAELTARLRELARQESVTPFVLMLAIFKTLLHRYSDQADIIVGTTTSGRTRNELTRIVGYFVKTLAIRTDAGDDPVFRDYLSQVKQHALGALENQEFPFPLLVDRLNPPRTAGRLPICTVMFGLQKPQRFQEAMQLFEEGDKTFKMGELEVHPFPLDQQEGQFDLTLELFDTADSFAAVLKYDTKMFDEETAHRIASHYNQLASSIVEDAGKRLSEFRLLPDEENQKLAAFATGNKQAEVAADTAHGLFERAAEQHPDRTALICDGEELSYEALNSRANQVAHVLLASGVQPGDIVACCLDRGPMVAPLVLGIMKSGGVYAPLDGASPAARLRSMIEKCGARLVITSAAGDEEVTPADATLLTVEEIAAQMVQAADASPAVDVEPAATAYVIHTSGSTGIPKGVCVPHQAFAAHIASITDVFGITTQDRVLQFSNLTFDPSLEQMFTSWGQGATLVMRGNELWSPAKLWETVQQQRLSVVNIPPAYFQQCSDVLDDVTSLTALRLLIIGGDVFPVSALDIWRDSGVKVLNAYGPTEAVITATTYDVTGHTQAAGSPPVGRPRPGNTAYVLDQHGRPAPVGVAGELYLGGPALASGYLNDPQLTAQRFVPDPFAGREGAKMYRTGDRAKWNAAGQIEFLGRDDGQIKIHGMRVETGEIESVLTSFDGIQAAHVAVRTDASDINYLVAWVVAGGEQEIAEETLRSFLQSKLPRYMTPRRYVTVPSLPVNASGKVDTTALPEPAAVSLGADHAYVAPCTPEEKILAEIWAEVLNVQPVGTHDNFFDLGGASLTSLRIVSKASDAGVTLNGEPIKPELLFEFPTVGELAAYIASQNDTATATRLA